jgi:hypothetical protein
MKQQVLGLRQAVSSRVPGPNGYSVTGITNILQCRVSE